MSEKNAAQDPIIQTKERKDKGLPGPFQAEICHRRKQD